MDRNRPATAAQAARTRELRLAGDVETIFRERIAVTARPNAERIRRSASRGLTVSDAHFEQSWESLCDLRLGARLHEIRTPTLLCAGAADPLLASNLRDFRRLPNATLHVFSSTSHFIPMEDPEGLTAMLLDFLERGPVTRAMLDARLAAVMAGAK
jgi:pimeloyl-ACP methyl ester carboxylesterase